MRQVTPSNHLTIKPVVFIHNFTISVVLSSSLVFKGFFFFICFLFTELLTFHGRSGNKFFSFPSSVSIFDVFSGHRILGWPFFSQCYKNVDSLPSGLHVWWDIFCYSNFFFLIYIGVIYLTAFKSSVFHFQKFDYGVS